MGDATGGAILTFRKVCFKVEIGPVGKLGFTELINYLRGDL
jgi:hypothetical protein